MPSIRLHQRYYTVLQFITNMFADMGIKKTLQILFDTKKKLGDAPIAHKLPLKAAMMRGELETVYTRMCQDQTSSWIKEFTE